MALEALQWEKPEEFEHRPEHDLESLFYVLVTICSYVEAPGCLCGPVALEKEKSICVNEWWSTYDRHVLARLKASQVSNLDKEVLSRFSPYWKDFCPVIQDLQKAIWKKECIVSNQQNVATHDAFLDILKKARDVYRDQEEEACVFAPTPEDQDVNSISHKRKNKNLNIESSSKRVRTQPENTGSISQSRPGPSRPCSSQTGGIRQLESEYQSGASFQFINYTA